MTSYSTRSSGVTVVNLRRRRRCWPLALAVATVAVVAGWLSAEPDRVVGQAVATVLGGRPGRVDEAALRAEFERRYPGDKPVNWAIAHAAVDLREQRAMGRFVLGLKLGEWGNDCSDFVDCAVDEGLGVGSRVRRGARDHLYGEDRRLFEAFIWEPGDVLQPGDILSVRHSPWYAPSEASCWHTGLIGPDGRVYDFTKLKRWREPRYGRTEPSWFLRHCDRPGQVVVSRLRAIYRYRSAALPPPRAGSTSAVSAR